MGRGAHAFVHAPLYPLGLKLSSCPGASDCPQFHSLALVAAPVWDACPQYGIPVPPLRALVCSSALWHLSLVRTCLVASPGEDRAGLE